MQDTYQVEGDMGKMDISPVVTLREQFFGKSSGDGFLFDL